MLASRFHLPGHLIPKVKEKGEFYRFPSFSLLILKEKGQKISKFSIILSQNFNKKAVVRNQTRRKFFEAVRELLPKIKPGYLVLFLPKRVLQGKSVEGVQKVVEQAFVRTGIIQ